jgi:L-lactate dehydrogenase complex protein LldF
MRAMCNEKGLIATLPMAGGWTAHRDMPVPAGKTFRELNKHR